MTNQHDFLKVNDLSSHDYNFVCDSQDVQAIRDDLGITSNDYDSFFVLVGDGEYIEVWGMYGTVPYLNKDIELVHTNGSQGDY